jgi:predicted DNA-binding transcriptional regulator YafY
MATKVRGRDHTTGREIIRRVLEIHTHLKNGACPSRKQLAAALEVSIDTVTRDLDLMRDDLGWHIHYDEVRQGYYYSEEPMELFGMVISQKEIRAFLVSYKAFEPYKGTPFGPLLRDAFKKLLGQMGVKDRVSEALDVALSFRPTAPEKLNTLTGSMIKAAMIERRALKFRLRKLDDTACFVETEHTGHPHHVSCIGDCWYLFLFVPSEQKVRLFALHEMRRVRLTKETFTPPTKFDPEEHLKGCFLVQSGTGDYDVVVELDVIGADLVRHRKLPTGSKLEELGDGRVRVEMHLTTLIEVERWILLLALNATVIGPEELEERIYQIAKELVARYERRLAERQAAKRAALAANCPDVPIAA